MIPPIASNFIGGKNTDTVLEYSAKLNRKDITPILNYLGEHYTETEPVSKTVSEYTSLVSRVYNSGITAEISVKPTQLGLLVSEDTFRQNAIEIVSAASDHNIFVWFDMENHKTIKPTISVITELQRKYSGSVGVCLQSNMRQTSENLDTLSSANGETHIRIVKGAYNPPENVAFTSDEEIDNNYINLVCQAIDSNVARVAIGSHDDQIITQSIDLLEESDIMFEIQMLMGVRDKTQRSLSSKYSVSQYIPYGPKWMSYTYRRIQENPSNLLFVGKAVYESILHRS